MSNAKRLNEKDPGETIVLSWDFACDLAEGETISGAPIIAIAVDNDLRRNTDASVSLAVNGDPAVDTTLALQSITGGLDGVDYKVRCQVSTSSTPASTIYKSSIVPVRNQ